MPLPDPASHARMTAIGIQVWARRDQAVKVSGADRMAQEARVRLASGEGQWLLVQRRPWDGSHALLVSDITALLGVDQCRFGQWSGGGAAGVAVSELAGRGISSVLAFGPLPAGVDPAMLIHAADLVELSASARARQSLWQALRPTLAP